MRILLSMCLLTGLFVPTTTWAQRTPGFDISSLDKSGDPCQNFYQYSCGGWMKANPVPSDQARWGRFDLLQDRNRTILQNLLESASADKPTRSAIEQKIGDYYYACMDQKTIDAKGDGPLKGELARVAALSSKKDLPELIGHMIKTGSGPFLRIASEPDAKNSAQIIAGVDQGGLGMPDRDYYLKTDEKSVEIQKKYIVYLTTVFTLLGEPAADAAKHAQAVMTLETELAKGSLDRVSRRDPEKMYHKMPLADLQALTPVFDWKLFLKSLGTPPLESVDVAVPAYFKVLDTVLSQDQPGEHQDLSGRRAGPEIMPDAPCRRRLNRPTLSSLERFSAAGRKCARAGSVAPDQVDNSSARCPGPEVYRQNFGRGR